MHGDQSRWVETEIHAIEVQKAAHHEACAREQHKGQRQLGDNQRRRPAPRTKARGSRSPSIFHDFAHACARDVQRGREAEHDSSDEADGRKEPEHHAVHGEHHPVRLADILCVGIEPPDSRIGETETDDAAHKREEHALD